MVLSIEYDKFYVSVPVYTEQTGHDMTLNMGNVATKITFYRID